jgi:hypothetical protein
MVNEIGGKCSTNGQEQDYRRGFGEQNLNRDHINESSRSWFRASSIIKLNKNQIDAHLF